MLCAGGDELEGNQRCEPLYIDRKGGAERRDKRGHSGGDKDFPFCPLDKIRKFRRFLAGARVKRSYALN